MQFKDRLSRILSGKNRVDYSSYLDEGDFVVVINSDSLKVTGNKTEKKIYHHFSGYPGGVKSLTLRQKSQSW